MGFLVFFGIETGFKKVDLTVADNCLHFQRIGLIGVQSEFQAGLKVFFGTFVILQVIEARSDSYEYPNSTN